MESQSEIQETLENADRNDQLIPHLLSLERRILIHECGPILCELHNMGKICLVSNKNIKTIDSLNHNDFWSVVHPLNQAIPELKCSYQDMLRLVKTLVDKAGSDGVAGMPNLSLIKWCSTNPHQAKQVVASATNLDQECLSRCAFAVQGLGDTDLAFELLDHPNKSVLSEGLKALGRLELDSIRTAKLVLDKCYKALTTEEDISVRHSSIETAFQIWDKLGPSEPYRQKQILNTITNAKQDRDLIQLSAMLSYYAKGLVAESINQILEALTSDSCNPNAIIEWLDHALYHRDAKWELKKVIDVFSAQIPRLTDPLDPQKIHEFCQWIWEEQGNTSTLFSWWLVIGQSQLCSLLSELVGEEGKGGKRIEIHKSDLPHETDDQIFMARKCVGFLWFHEITAASILLSIVKNGKKTARQTAENLLFDPLLLSYCGEIRNFLTDQIKSSSKRISHCSERLLEKQDAYLNGLKQAENLDELVPSIEQRRAAAARNNELNKDIQKQAYERSIFSQLVTHQTLLYGKKSFSLIHDMNGEKVPNITPLAEYSYSTELPRLAIVDPVGFDQMLAVFRVERWIRK